MLFLYYLVGDVHVCMGCMGCIDCMGCTGGNFLLILMAPSWRRSATVSSNGQMMFHDLTGEGKEWILPDLRPSRWTKRRRKDNWRVKQTFSKCTSIFDGFAFSYIRDGWSNWFKIYDANRITTWNTFCLVLLTIRKIVKTKQWYEH
jgi:hypothetical protein